MSFKGSRGGKGGGSKGGGSNVTDILDGIASNPAAQPKKDKKSGRIGRDGQEKVIDKTAVKEAMPELEQGYIKEKAAKDRFSTMIKKVAEKSGLLASVVKKIVKARVDDNVEEKQREYEQLALIFDEIGSD